MKGRRLRFLAATFDYRRWKASNIPLPAGSYEAIQDSNESDPAFRADYRGGILGKADAFNRIKGAAYVKYRLHHWTRRQLYNRQKWLKGELSRLILKQKVCKSPEERLALILKRREQIAMYSAALDYYKPLHEAVRQARKIKARTKNRQQAKTDKRKREIAEALNESARTLAKSKSA